MELDRSSPAVVRDEPLPHNLGGGSSSSPSFNQQSEESRGPEDVGKCGTPITDDQTPMNQGFKASSDTIEALIKRISELERRSNLDPAGCEPYEDAAQSQVITEQEERRKVEAFLYNHRKEWEKEVGPRGWRLLTPSRRYGDFGCRMERLNRWKFHSTREYRRPNPFEPPYNFGDGHDDVGISAEDEYDQIIDFGGRRERLRKNFEWDLDRLWLEEELDRRRREKIQTAKISEEQQRNGLAVGTTLSTGDEEAEEGGQVLPKFAEPKLNRLEWYPFKKLSSVAEEHACVVDILIGEPIIDDDLGDHLPWYGYRRRRIRKPEAPKDRNAVAPMVAGKPLFPERIRIHSAALFQILGTLLGKSLDGPDACTIVFTRPFKALTLCEPALRDWCGALEKKFSAPSRSENETPAASDDPMNGPYEGSTISHDSNLKGVPTADGAETQEHSVEISDSSARQTLFKAQDSNSVAGFEDEAEHEEDDEEKGDENESSDDLKKSPTALEHLKCLLSFIDSDISAKQAYLNSSECRKASFSDLWQLFRPGLEVISSDGKQAYRVIKVTSAKHSASRGWDTYSFPQNKRKKKAPFSITCVYIDFDGTHLGPVRRVFDFKRFDGERDVNSLEVYPLRFHPLRRSEFSDLEWEEIQTNPSDHRYRQKLIRRGAKFIEVAATKHMYYAGPTLEVRDEVESQVVIDFETAFSVEDTVQQEWKPNLESLVGGPSAEDDEEDGDEENDVCEAVCCHGESVHDDSYVDQKQSSDYITSLLPKAGNMTDQPSVAIIPRPLKELQTSSGSTIISEEEMVIMSYRVFGFVLRNRKWAKLDLSFLSDVHTSTKQAGVALSDDGKHSKEEQPPTAFDRLVLEPGHRGMIESLTAQHFRDKKSTTGQKDEFDIIKGKGKGLIILLHGAPGVGKTSTAEGVAERFQKPLFQITCGDLGTTASEVEKSLETNFSLANRWDCILLLDEADVFLAQRTREDFRRNGLVAVFLRVMEYYAGVLFLTTNRVGDFDEAFTSRIHISLYYPELSEEKTVKVFKINLRMIEKRFEEKGRKINVEKFQILDFAKAHFTANEHARWNGRQIRNACQTALALAESDSYRYEKPEVTLTADHFQTVRKAYLEFAQYMHDVYKMNTAQRAKFNELRASWTNENNPSLTTTTGVGGTVGDRKRADFLSATRGWPPTSLPQHSPAQQGWQSPSAMQQQQHRYRYGSPVTLQPGYPDPSYSQAQAQSYPAGQNLNYPGAAVVINPSQGPRDGLKEFLVPQPLQQSQQPQQTQQAPLAPSSPHQHHQQHMRQVDEQPLNHGIQAMYEGPVQHMQPPYYAGS